MQLTKIISGGQTGADQGGLEAAEHFGITTGGYIPRGFMTELGSQPILGIKFNLKEIDSGYPFKISLTEAYKIRTRLNILKSDGTIIFGNIRSRGSGQTLRGCITHKKSYLVNPTPLELRSWLIKEQITILNVAGNRESKSPGIQESTKQTIIDALK